MAPPTLKQPRSAAQVALLAALCLTGVVAFTLLARLQRSKSLPADMPVALLAQQAGGSGMGGPAAGLRDRLLLEQQGAAADSAAVQPRDGASSQTAAADSDDDADEALPWRAFAHLGAAAAASNTDARHAGAQQPVAAYGVSAFIDVRPPAPQIALIAAVANSLAMQLDWQCLIRAAASPGSGVHGGLAFTSARSRIIRRSTAVNNERWFTHQATTLFCELPPPLAALQLAEVPPLRVTLARTASGGSGGGSDSIAPSAWLRVERPAAAEHDEQRQGVAVCTPPLHTDAYAATLVGWAELQRLLGASTVFVYAHNPGPFTQPLLAHYHAAGGFFELREWVIPASILSRPDQPCLLPLFARPSRAAVRHGGVTCAHHQDALGIAWWGQTLAIQDCLYRAMARRYRWVVVADFDELLLPRQPPGDSGGITTWASLISQLTRNGSEPPAQQYSLQGVRTCPACALPGAHPAAAAVAAAAAATGGGACEPPSASFKHLLWPAVVPGGSRDHVKSIVDPVAVEQAHVHSTLAFHATSAGRSVTVPRDLGVKVHDRVHDVHTSPTFATVMLPLLRHDINELTVPTAVGGGMSLPQQSRAWAAAAVGGGSNWTVDTALCRTELGRQLSAAIDGRLQRMRAQRVLPDAWLRLDEKAANVYGGYSFARWAPAL